MCGIAGFVSVPPLTGAAGVLSRMMQTIAHRGPDGHGSYHDEHAYLGHQRLAIVDVATGAQPMFNEDGSRLIIYNGELFNHALFRPELERAGHTFKTDHSDTEVILHGYEEWGPASILRYRGMFAFAIWDRESKRLFCVRDRLGIKPFYYYWDGKLFAFASEIKALLEHPRISAEVNEAAMPQYLAFGYTSDDSTLFRNIRKLMPGHFLTLDVGNGGRLAIEQYWDAPVGQESPEDSDWVGETRRRLEETVRMRLMSDVPLGMFLSGGVDSSCIAAIIKKTTGGDQPVKTFSVGYHEEKYSELSYASTVAKAIGTDHHEVRVGMEEFFDTLPRLIWHEDEPIAWPSSVSLYFVSKLAREHVTVVLTGEGADELFGGYVRYRWNLLNRRALGAYQMLAPGFVRRHVRLRLGSTRLICANLRRKLQHTFVGREETHEALFLDNFYCAYPGGQVPEAAYEPYMRYWNRYPDASPLARMLYADQKTYLVELLMKQDQMSMAASIESRVPFLDHTFVEFAARVPDRLKIRGVEQKWVLKKAVEGLLPQEIIYRTKMGFPTPIRQWLMQPEAKPLFDAVLDRKGFVAQYVDLAAVKPMIERHLANQEDATDRIWRLLNLQLWGDVYITGQRDRWWGGILASAQR
jgi:asparagine synthase (glutamine-hydrolysing)